MVASQNGWRANDPSVVSSRLIPRTGRKVRVRNGAPGDLLLEVASAWHRFVEPLDVDQLDDWGYAERLVRGGTDLSNHASGTALDINALKHVMGVAPARSFTAHQIETIRKIMVITGGVVRWGGEWSRPDGMHVEIAPGQDEADCERALRAVRDWVGPGFDVVGGVLVLKFGMTHPDVRKLQTILTTRYPAYAKWSPITDFFGEKTLAAVKEFQRRTPGLAVDGEVGPATRRALGL